MKTTLKDIAERVGVTSQLVSFYLNHPETTRVAKETRDKIDEAVKQLDYHPNSVARALCTGKTKTIGLIIGGLTARKRGCYIHSLMNEAKKHGYHLLTAITNYDQEEEREVLEYMMGRQVDGIIYTLYLSPQNDLYRRLQETGFPILMHEPQAKKDFNSIGHDYRNSLPDAVKAFQALGKNEIMYLGASIDREYEFLRKLEQKEAFSLTHEVISPEPNHSENMISVVLKKRPSAILTFNVPFLCELFEEIARNAPGYRPACITAYSLPFDRIPNELVIGVIRRFHKERTKQEISRMLEIIGHPAEKRKKIELPTEYVPSEKLEALRNEQLNDPYYKQFK